MEKRGPWATLPSKIKGCVTKGKNINKAHDARFKRQGDEALPG